MNAGKYIYSKLSADAGVTALVGDRIYPVWMPQNASFPAIVYTTSNAPLDQTKDHAGWLDKTDITFDIIADFAQGASAYNSTIDIDIAIRAAIDFVNSTSGGVTVDGCKYLGGRDIRDEDRVLCVRQSNYQMIIRK